MQFELISDSAELSQLKPAWEELFQQLGGDVTVFSSYAWYECWWRHYPKDARLAVIVAREADELVGIFPFMAQPARLHGFPVRLLGFIENRNSLHNDLLIMPRFRETVLREALEFICSIKGEWDALQLKNLPVTSPNYTMLCKLFLKSGHMWHERPSYDSPMLTTTGTWAEYLAGRTQRTRKTLRNIANTLNRTGKPTIRQITTADEYNAVKKDIFEVAQSSWTEQIGDSLATPVNRAFFEDLSHAAAARGWLSLWTLSLDGKFIAFEYHLRACGKQHAMRASFNPAFSLLSPGTYLEREILERTFNETTEAITYDFGGCFDQYKKKWTDSSVHHCTITAFNDRLWSRLAAFHEIKTVGLFRRIRDRLRLIRSQEGGSR